MLLLSKIKREALRSALFTKQRHLAYGKFWSFSLNLSDVRGSWPGSCILHPGLTFSRLLNNIDPFRCNDLLQSRSGFLMCHVHHCRKFMTELKGKKGEKKNKHTGFGVS